MQSMIWENKPYLEALADQMELVELVASGVRDEVVVFCSHPPVVTIGRSVQPGDITTWVGETVEVSRGGRATYHGPNQVVIYPIIDLKKSHRENLPPKDVHQYLRLLENVVVESLAKIGVQSQVRVDQQLDSNGRKLNLTGVWVGGKKIASIGIAVKKWITYHGIAVNLYSDRNAFQGIQPCGLNPNDMTSVEEVLHQKIDRHSFEQTILSCLSQKLYQ